VLGNLQVLVVGVVAWWLLGERPHAGLVASVPVQLVGVTLVSALSEARRTAATRSWASSSGCDLGRLRRLPARAPPGLEGPAAPGRPAAVGDPRPRTGTGLVLAALLGELEVPSGPACCGWSCSP
jgi:hypothetical protein